MVKKLITSILLAIFLLTSLGTNFAYAQTWYNQPFDDWYEKVYDPSNQDEIFGERYTAAQVEWVFYGFVAFIFNHLGDAELNQCLISNADSDIAVTFAACAGQITNLFSSLSSTNNSGSLAENTFLNSLSTRPISSVAYFKDVGQRLHLVPEAKAQGFGFGAANPVLALWRVVRNTAYFFIIIIIIAMAFMIMFRVKISPQTVISVQSALPKIVIALLLIAFSYAIAGFLIDLMYVVMGILAGLLTTGETVSHLNWSEMFGAMTTERSVFSLMIYYLLSFTIALIPALFTTGPLGIFLQVSTGFVLIPLLVGLIVLIILLFASFRIMWLLFKTYAMILLQIIIGPFQILLGTIGPGGFGAWIRGLAAHLAVYPTVAFMFVMSFVFMRGAYPENMPTLITNWLLPFNPATIVSSTNDAVWHPPLTVGEGAQGVLWLGVSLAIILLIPNVANIIKGMVEGKPFGYGSAIGQAFGPMGAAWGSQPVSMVRREYTEQRLGKSFARWGEDISKRKGTLAHNVGETLQTVGGRLTGEGQPNKK